MNILDIQDKLKGLSESQLAQEMQMPTGAVPQFLVLGEMNRRQTMRQSMQQQGAGAQTVAQELLNGAGVPSEGMSEMGRSMAPKSSIAQNTGIGALPQQAPPPEQGGIAALAPTGMYAGGPVRKMNDGQAVTDEERKAEIIRRRNNIFRGIGSANDYAQNTVDQLLFGLPMAGVETMATAIGDVGAGVTGMIPGLEGVSMGLYDMAGQSAESADRYMREGLFPDDPYYQEKPDSHGAMAEPQAPNNKPKVTLDLDKIARDFARIDAERAAKNGTGGSSGSGSGSGGGGGKMSTYEQMLADAMANAEKKAKQDKWLALAQAGMALMSSTQPNLAGAIGEAGKVGIEALQSARDTGEATKLKLAQEQFSIEQDREARARSAASAGRPKPRTASGILSEISSINEILSGMTQTDEMGMPIPPDRATLATMADLKAQADALIAEYGRLQASGVDLADVPQ